MNNIFKSLSKMISPKQKEYSEQAATTIFVAALNQTEHGTKKIYDYSNLTDLFSRMCYQIEDSFKRQDIPFPLEQMHDSCLDRFMHDITLGGSHVEHDAVRIYLIGYAYQKYFRCLPESIKKKLSFNEGLKPKINKLFDFDIDKILGL